MSYPPHSAYPPPVPGAVTPMVYPHPIQPPPGYSVLAVTVNRGPYIVPVPATGKLKIDGQTVPIPGEGTWHMVIAPGPHDVRYTDFMGVPLVTTALAAHPGAAHHLSFRFGAWRNRVHDGHGTDVTKFGLWSNYTILLLVFAVVGVVCCGLLAPLATS
ncbi:hypothetical protein DLJ47_04305 [Micromonospora sp. S4605]|nr:hypothetical protein DLJ47_04305 [Micromonospora sp. S4605]